MAGNNLQIIFIGGIEEIGKNMTLIEYRDQILVIDAGLGFPDETMPGVDYVINDISYLRSNANKIVGLVCTHGHLDHIGGLPYMLSEISTVIYATSFTRALIKRLMNDHPDVKYKVKEIRPNKKVQAGYFNIDPIMVNHSIVSAISLAINTPAGTVVHTGDFKIDHTPVFEQAIDLNKFSEYGNRGVLALMSDSTNALKSGTNESESRVRETLKSIFLRTKGRIIFSTFSSQINRIRQVIQLAKETGKKIALSGRSIIENVEISLGLKIIEGGSEIFVDISKAKKYKKENIVIITTGTQGEESSALSLMAEGRHKNISIDREDVVVISSSNIPGNEKSIARMLNLLAKRECTVITSHDLDIHTSGHAADEDLRLVLNLVRPRYFIPVHGESMHQVAHKKIALNTGIKEENIFVLERGTRLEINKKSARVLDQLKLKDVFVEGREQTHINREILNERLSLSKNGTVSVVVFIRKNKAADISIASKGFINRMDNRITDLSTMAVNRIIEEGRGGSDEALGDLDIRIKKELRKLYIQEIGKNPLIFTFIRDESGHVSPQI